MIGVLIVISAAAGAFAGCSSKPAVDWHARSFADAERAARGTTVAFFMWGGSAQINTWVDTYVVSEMKRQYDITVWRVPMDTDVFVNKLITEKEAGKSRGSMDLLWINGENFYNAMKAGVLFGPFAERLPNFRKYVSAKAVADDFGFPVRGYEAPWGRAQFVFEYDSAKISDPLRSFAALLGWAKEHPGEFTYPEPPFDFTGSAFIRQALYAVTGGSEQYMGGFSKSLYQKEAPKLWAYLNEIAPYLWRQGTTYPKDIAALDLLFERGEVAFDMSYDPGHAESMILNGQYPPTVRTFVMRDDSIYNTNFTAIPFNAPNVPAAMVLANFLLSPEAQYSKNEPRNWGSFTALDLAKLPPDWRTKFEHLNLGQATLPFSALDANAVPEAPAGYLRALQRDWAPNVLSR